MWTVAAVLLLPSIWGILVFGFSALMVLFFSVLTAVVSEYIVNLILKKNTVKDGSAVVTGLLVGMNMPPEIPLYIPVLSTLFAILIVKWTFGGLGNNWANPAIAGRVFAFLSWSKPMMTWKMPAFPWQRKFFSDTVTAASTFDAEGISYDAVSGATPLGMLKEGAASLTDLQSAGAVIEGPLQMIREMIGTTGYHISALDYRLTEWWNSLWGSAMEAGAFDPFIGLVPGSVGEVSALLILIAAGILFARKIITWEIPLFFLGSFALLVWVFGGFRYGGSFFSGNPWYQLMSGGLMLAAFFMATDMVTSPATRPGMMIFGFGCGLLTFLVRFYGNYPEGASLAILFMNILTPMLDRYIRPRRFGAIRRKRRSA